jgi:hypothetical protein
VIDAIGRITVGTGVVVVVLVGSVAVVGRAVDVGTVVGVVVAVVTPAARQ